MPVAMLSSSLMTNPQRYGRFNALDTVYSALSPAMFLIKPASISHTGTSTTLGDNGKISLSAVSTLNVNGCFTADFNNYMIVLQQIGGAADIGINLQWRASGSNATGSNYYYQQVGADGTSVSNGRGANPGTFARLGVTDSVSRNGHVIYVFSPFLAQSTVTRSISIDSKNGSRMYETATTHNLSNSYDGFSINTPSGSMTGTMTIYGIKG